MENSLENLFEDHKRFALNNFLKSTPSSSLKGLKREIKEVEHELSGYNYSKLNKGKLCIEYVDCFMYLLDSMNRAGLSIEDLKEYFKIKLEINKKREWNLNKDNSYSHIK